LTRFDDSSRLQRTQDLPTRYFDAGQFYWSSSNMWKKWESGIYQPSAVHILPKWKVHDIDTEEDWDLAEQIFVARVIPKLNL
jgi:N-acylneuraminate cytidylyltransferase